MHIHSLLIRVTQVYMSASIWRALVKWSSLLNLPGNKEEAQPCGIYWDHLYPTSKLQVSFVMWGSASWIRVRTWPFDLCARKPWRGTFASYLFIRVQLWVVCWTLFNLLLPYLIISFVIVWFNWKGYVLCLLSWDSEKIYLIGSSPPLPPHEPLSQIYFRLVKIS